MDDLELSLDEIIKKKSIKSPGGLQKFGDRKTPPSVKRLSDGKNPSFPVPDARFKLMKNNNKRPVVADARERLQALRSRTGPVHRPPHVGGAPPHRQPLHGRLGVGVRPMDVDMFDYGPPRSDMVVGNPLMRTIENEMMRLPARRRPFDWDRPIEDDNMDMIIDRPERLNLNAIPVNPGQGFKPGAPDWDDITITVRTSASMRPQPQQGILKRPSRRASPPTHLVLPPPVGGGPGLTLSQRFNRDRNAEASAKVEALKAQLKAAKGEPAVPAKLEEGHRIVVSNLVPSVTQEDVQELFGDVGDLISAKLVRPGVAEVVYEKLKDALEAVEIYHNRQLDKQPMKCLLVKNQARKNMKPPVELDMTTLRNALHKKVAS